MVQPQYFHWTKSGASWLLTLPPEKGDKDDTYTSHYVEVYQLPAGSYRARYTGYPVPGESSTPQTAVQNLSDLLYDAGETEMSAVLQQNHLQ